MKIVTYFEPLGERGNPDDIEVLHLFYAIWGKVMGHSVFQLSEVSAKEHPKWDKFNRHINELETVNDRGFENACYKRWLAASMFPPDETFIFADYDVFPNGHFFGFVPTDRFLNYSMTGNPGMISGRAEHFEKIVDKILGYHNIDCLEHVSDMTILNTFNERLFEDRLDWIKCYGEPGWQKAPLIHFGNAWTKEPDGDESGPPRSELIKETIFDIP
jgi:hypothetical protein